MASSMNRSIAMFALFAAQLVPTPACSPDENWIAVAATSLRIYELP
jgi:hypothetical protein